MTNVEKVLFYVSAAAAVIYLINLAKPKPAAQTQPGYFDSKGQWRSGFQIPMGGFTG